MKLLMEKLASGNAAYETPDVEISENRIAVELHEGECVEGEISVVGKNGLPVKGIAFSTDDHVVFENNQFYGVNNTLHYKISGKNLYEGQVCSGTISVITTGGDYAIPFGITVKKDEITSTTGSINTLQDFLQLVQESYDEALLLFMSKEFRNHFLKNDSYGYTLYNQLMKNHNRHIALEEFLVGMDLKKRVSIRTKENLKEFTDITENYADVVEIHKNTWGYVDVDVQVEGDFFYNCKSSISSEEFNGRIAEYRYYINAAKLHGGSNHGRITFSNVHERIVYDVIIVNQKDSIEAYLSKKKSSMGLMKNYLNFRTGKIDSFQWMDEMGKMADERLSHDSKDVVGMLAKAHIAIVQDQNEEAANYLNQVSETLSLNKNYSVEEYCFYLYLRTLHKNNPSYTSDIKEEIKKYYEGGHDTWQLLWMLFYMDERFEENPSLKYTMIKRLFGEGCYSPVMYYEAANIIAKQPELLRIINKFEIQVLNFAGKYHMTNEELAKQTAELMAKEKTFQPNYFQILTRFYEDTKQDEVLGAICSMIINGEKKQTEYFKWLELGVLHDLKITNLYEYYVYTADTSQYKAFDKAAYKYFSYGTETLGEKKDYFYANLIVNMKDDPLFDKFREGLERYATEQLLMGRNNRFLRMIYNNVLTKDFVVDDMESKLSQVLNTYEIRVNNENVKNVLVCHKEMEHVQMVSVTNGYAYVQIYTSNPVIVFVDGEGNILSDVSYEKEQMKIDIHLEQQHSMDMDVLRYVEDIIAHPLDHQGEVVELKRAVEMPGISRQYELTLKEFIVDYYYKGFDKGDLDIYILSLNMEELTIPSRNKVMEILIERNLIEMVYPYVVRYGYQGIEKDLLKQMCLELVEREDMKDNKLLAEMCAVVFRNGCREDSILVYLGKYYEAGSLELQQLFLSIQAKKIKDNTLAERLLTQYIFEANSSDAIYNIYREYLECPTNSMVRRAFYTYVTFNYFIKKMQCPDIVWEILEQEYINGFQTTLITKIAFVEILSKKDELTKQEIEIAKKLIADLAKNHINLDFYKKFNKWFKVPFDLIDKTIIDFRTNPKHKVYITYQIKTAEGFTKQVHEEMRSIYQGIFTKEIIMFYGEEINYSIKEYSDEIPNGKVVDNYSVRITDKNAYNDETRFGMINGMMICRSIDRKDAAREIMQSYELDRIAGQELFKLL
ncbi:MAG: DUF5717 family protein [Eubacterium sp.]|nr:DUF5717 family protein [Eubacterium sp.]